MCPRLDILSSSSIQPLDRGLTVVSIWSEVQRRGHGIFFGGLRTRQCMNDGGRPPRGPSGCSSSLHILGPLGMRMEHAVRRQQIDVGVYACHSLAIGLAAFLTCSGGGSGRVGPRPPAGMQRTLADVDNRVQDKVHISLPRRRLWT